MTRRKTHEEFVAQMQERNPNVDILSQYDCDGAKVLVKCKIDNHEWYATPSNLLRKYGCPKCAGKMKKTHIEFVEALRKKNPNLEVIGEYITSKTKILVRCCKCSYEWSILPQSLLLRGYGCIKCSGLLPKTRETFLEELSFINNNVEIVSEFEKTKLHVIARCKIDGHQWRVTPRNLLKGHGCPACAISGFNSSKKAWLYVYKFLDYGGFGITNTPKARHTQHRTTFKKHNIQAELIKTISGTGTEIQQLESHLKRTLPIVNTGIEGFKTEAILAKDADQLFAALKNFQTEHNSPLTTS